MSRITSTRGSVIKHSSDDGIDKIGNPHRNARTGVARHRKRRRHCHEQDIRETEQQAQADVEADAAPDLA